MSLSLSLPCLAGLALPDLSVYLFSVSLSLRSILFILPETPCHSLFTGCLCFILDPAGLRVRQLPEPLTACLDPSFQSQSPLVPLTLSICLGSNSVPLEEIMSVLLAGTAHTQ